VSEQGARLLLRRGLSIITLGGAEHGIIAYPIDRIELPRTPNDFATASKSRIGRVELVLNAVVTDTEVMTGTFIYNVRNPQLAQVRPGDRLSGFSVHALIRPDEKGQVDTASTTIVAKEPIGRITSTVPFTQTFSGKDLKVGDVINSLRTQNFDLNHASILLVDSEGGQPRYVLVTFFEPGSGAGGDLFTLWCQACFGGICRLFCG
jgi:hypothetical protein